MEEKDFEGTIVLEKMSALGKLDEFFEAIDSDNLKRARQLMRMAGIDLETVETVLRKIVEGD